MKCIQLNTNHCSAAQDLLSQTINELKIDVAIISEQYKNLDRNVWEKDSSSKAAVWACGNKAIEEGMKEPAEGFTRIKIGGVYVYSCYISPNISLEAYKIIVDNIAQDASQHNPIIIGGDFNASAIDWGCQRTNNRGRILLEALSVLDIVLLNKGNKQTFRRAGYGSIVDITFISNTLAKDVTWEVSEHYTHSDHQALIFEIKNDRRTNTTREKTITQGWASEKLDAAVLTESLSNQQIEIGSVNEMANRLVHTLQSACYASMPRRRHSNRRKENYWWNSEIAELRKECLKIRRIYQRGRLRPDFLAKRQAYHIVRKRLKNAINKSKATCFKQLCDEADTNPWGNAFRIVMSRLKGKKSVQVTCPILIKKIIANLFPHGEPFTGETYIPNMCEPEPINGEEILKMCTKIGDKKAPGPDGIPNKALKIAMKTRPELFVAMFSKCLEEGIFPTRWKKQKLILIPKPGKTLGEPQSYRPICLLDTLGKCLERIIYSRILRAVEEAHGISDMQFGFRKERSTVDAINLVVNTAKTAIQGKGRARKYCAVITLDIKNAFNSAGWDYIISALQKLQIPEYLIKLVKSYFSDRTLWYETEDGTESTNITAGVPQGSVLGPLLWNIMYDGIFKLKVPEEVKIVGFADDVAITVNARNLEEVQLYANETIRTIKIWLKSVNLNLADHKTEAVLISSKRAKENLKIQVGRMEILSAEVIKYLGILIDSRLNFKKHSDYICQKAVNVVNTLARIMPNIGGPRHSRRILLSHVAKSILLYGSPIWESSLRCTSRKDMMSIFRRSCLRVCCGYRTISLEAVSVISGLTPIDISAKEFAKIYVEKNTHTEIQRRNIRDSARRWALDNWQRRWENCQAGRWTYRLIPNIERWINRKYGELNYHLTQFLSGHGGFRSYLYRFGHDDLPRCPSCPEQDEDAEHVIFSCDRFAEERRKLEEELGLNLSPENIVPTMLTSETKWNCIAKFITNVNETLRVEEQKRKKLRSAQLLI